MKKEIEVKLHNGEYKIAYSVNSGYSIITKEFKHVCNIPKGFTCLIERELETYIAKSIAERYELSKEEADLFSDCVQVDYDVELGFTPTLDRPASEFAGTTFWDSSSDLARKLTEICRPHQGNIKTYLEEAMQELINEYFS